MNCALNCVLLSCWFYLFSSQTLGSLEYSVEWRPLLEEHCRTPHLEPQEAVPLWGRQA